MKGTPRITILCFAFALAWGGLASFSGGRAALAAFDEARAEESAKAAWFADYDRDGNVTQDDADALLRAVATGLREAPVRMDLNCDGHVTAADAALLLRCAAGMQAESVPAGTPVGEAAGADTVYAEARRAAQYAMYVDLTPYLERLPADTLANYDALAGQHAVFAEMAEAFTRAARAGAEAGTAVLLGGLTNGHSTVLVPQYPSRALTWQQAAALYRALRGGTAGAVADAMVTGVAESAEGVRLYVEFSLFDELFSFRTEEECMTGKFALAYLSTVYDGAGVVKPYASYPLSGAYLSTLIHPLGAEGDYLIKDGWYDPRDNRTRMHTGTDIKAPARTPIHSCTSGVVTHIGYMDTPGNYVVVLDPYGFEYHYYHLIERTTAVQVGDIVSQGDVLGLVGSTGNSAANHLHLTVITPEYSYINPYDMFLEAGITPIRLK